MAKSCAGCVYYLNKSGYCVLLARKIPDPANPPCENILARGEARREAVEEQSTQPPAPATQAPRAVTTTPAAPRPEPPQPRIKVEEPKAQESAAVEVIRKLALEYAPTGISELDDVLGGGFIRGKTYLVAGETGCGKTIFSIQFLLSGAVKYNEPGVYVAIDEPTEQLIKGLKRFGWDVTPLIREGRLRFLDMRTHFSKIYLSEERRKLEPRYIIESILKAANRIGAKRLAIDPIAPLIYGGSQDDALYVREFLREMVFAIERVGTITTIMTSEIPTGSNQLSRFGVEEFLASGIIVLGLEEKDSEIYRYMYVRKARWAPAKPVKFLFDIEPGIGIVIRGHLQRSAEAYA